MSKQDYQVIIDNLTRLNLVHQKFESETIRANADSFKIERSYEEVSLTHLGQAFVRKCRIPFTDIHITKIKKILLERVEDIARNPRNSEKYKQLHKQLIGIYEHMAEIEVESSLGEALGFVLWKNSEIDEFNDFPLLDSIKEQIVDRTLSYFKSIYP